MALFSYESCDCHTVYRERKLSLLLFPITFSLFIAQNLVQLDFQHLVVKETTSKRKKKP